MVITGRVQPSSGQRVLRLSHSAVVSEYRQRDRCLREECGYDLHLVTPERWPEGGRMVEAEPESSALPLHVIPVHGRRHPSLFWYAPRPLARLLAAVKPDIVDLHEEPFSLAVGAALPLIRRYAPAAVICTYTAQNLPKRYPPPFSWLERRALAATARAYPCSTGAADRLRARGFTGGIDVIPLGVTLPDAAPRRASGTVIGFVSRLEAYKGGAIAIQAFSQIAPDTEATLLVVGAGAEAAHLRELAARSGAGARIHFTGAVSQQQAIEHISAVDILLVPSLSTRTWIEQFGRVAAQGLAAGCVVIASDSGALPEVVGDAGILVPEGDVEACARAISAVLAAPAERARLSTLAQLEARRFSWTAVAAAASEMYQRALVSDAATAVVAGA